MLLSLDKGRGPGRGWWPIAMDVRLVDFFSGVWQPLFFVFFFEAFSHVVFQRFFLDFGRVLESKMGSQTSFGGVFCDFFLRASWNRFFYDLFLFF